MSGDESKEYEWQAVKRRMAAVIAPFEERTSGPSPYFKLTATERTTLRAIVAIPPATRSYQEVRTLLNLLRGADLLLQLDDDTASTVASSMRLIEFEKGNVIATESNAADAYLLVVDGSATVLIRDMAAAKRRSALFRLYPGESFAETSLVENSRRAPSLVAGDDGAVLLRVVRPDFHAALTSWHLELLERKMTALESVPSFMPLDRALLFPLAERMSQEKVYANVVLVAQSEPATKLYVIASGEARVLLRTESGEVLHIATLGPGTLFGEIGIMQISGVHTASVVSAADMTLFVVSKPDLQVRSHPCARGQLATALVAATWPTDVFPPPPSACRPSRQSPHAYHRLPPPSTAFHRPSASRPSLTSLALPFHPPFICDPSRRWPTPPSWKR